MLLFAYHHWCIHTRRVSQWSLLSCPPWPSPWTPRAALGTSAWTWRPRRHQLHWCLLGWPSDWWGTCQSEQENIFITRKYNISAYIGPGRNLLQCPVCLTEPLLYSQTETSPVVLALSSLSSLLPVVVAQHFRHGEVGIGIVEEDVESNLCPLLLNVLDEDRDLHGSPDLLPDGGDPGRVGHQAVHGDSWPSESNSQQSLSQSRQSHHSVWRVPWWG